MSGWKSFLNREKNGQAKDRKKKVTNMCIFLYPLLFDEEKKTLREGKEASTVKQDSASTTELNKNIDLLCYQGVEKVSS